MFEIPFRDRCLLFCALLLVLGAVDCTSPVKNIGTWKVTNPIGKSTRLERCGGLWPGPYMTLYWSQDKLMLVKEPARGNSKEYIGWQIDLPAQLQGAVFYPQRMNPCVSGGLKIDVLAVRSPYYWLLSCTPMGCTTLNGPFPTPTTDQIEILYEPAFPPLNSRSHELLFVSLKSAYQVQLATGIVSAAYHWNETTLGAGFHPTQLLSVAISSDGNQRYKKQLSVAMHCKQYESPFSKATCVVAMGKAQNEIDSTTFFSPTTANFHFNNVTSKVSWTDSTPEHGLIAIHQRGKPEAEPLDLPFLPGEVWAGPNWRDDRHESGIVASYVPGTYQFRLWYIETKWNRHVPEVVLRRGPVTVTGTSVPILPHPRGFPGESDPTSTALAYNPNTKLYEVNVYSVPRNPTANLVCPLPKYQFFAPNCKPSSCEIESRGDCPHTSICFGTARGVFQCCRGPPL